MVQHGRPATPLPPPSCLPRHLRALLTGAGLEEAAAFAATSPHPRLWQLVGEHALQAQNLGLAERASVQCADYPVSPGQWVM